VCAGLKLPQAPEGAQLQSTPPFALSFVNVAVSDAVPPAAREAGAPVIVPVIVTGVTV
jgi:hypothetical protein